MSNILSLTLGLMSMVLFLLAFVDALAVEDINPEIWLYKDSSCPYHKRKLAFYRFKKKKLIRGMVLEIIIGLLLTVTNSSSFFY